MQPLLPFVRLTFLFVCTTSYQIRNCETYVDVREDTETSIVCDGIGATHRMYWSIYSTNFDEQTIGDCNTLDCTNNLPDYEVSRPTPTSSELKVKANFREKANKRIKCSRWNNVSSVSCKLRIVYPASPKLLLFNTDGATWTVEATCVVPKVFSSDNTYACILKRIGPDQGNVITVREGLLSRTEIADSSTTYYSGRCSWNENLASVSGEYTYDISILPGKPDVVYTIGTTVIDPPADPEIHCHRYAIENTNHTCRCRTSASRPGNPTPQVTWNQNPGSSELKLVNVQREDNGTVYTCQLTWGPKDSLTVKTASYTLQVAYGPSRATISDSTNLTTNGPERFSISCTAFDVNPGANFEWDGIKCDNERIDGNTSVCTFVPIAEEGGTEVKCTAINKETSSFSAVASEIIRLKYPPLAPPIITGLIKGQPLLEGTRVLITCVVQGGNPPVTSVDFSCGSHVDTVDTVYEADVIGQSYVSSNIFIESLMAADNGTVCTCSAVWTPKPDFYRSNSTVTILVIENTDLTSSNVGAAVGGGVAAFLVLVAVVVVGIFIYRKYFGNDRYERPLPRQEESNYTGLVLYEDAGNRQQQTGNHTADLVSPYVNEGMNVETEAVEDGVDYVNTSPGESSGAAVYDRLEPASQESSNYTGLILNRDAGTEQSQNEHDYQNTLSTGTSAVSSPTD